MNGRPVRDPFFRPARVQGADQPVSAAGRPCPKTPAARASVPRLASASPAGVTAQLLGFLVRPISPRLAQMVIVLELAALAVRVLA